MTNQQERWIAVSERARDNALVLACLEQDRMVTASRQSETHLREQGVFAGLSLVMHAFNDVVDVAVARDRTITHVLLSTVEAQCERDQHRVDAFRYFGPLAYADARQTGYERGLAIVRSLAVEREATDEPS